MDVPDFAAPVLRFLDEVNTHNPDDAGPIVIHCSAGVGRTGTFLAIDAMRKMAEAENKVDVLGYATYMRTRRPNMIQTEHQYVFVYETLLEAFFCGTTQLSVEDVDYRWNDLVNEESLKGQLQSLQAMFPEVSRDRCNGGNQPENVPKNRFQDYIPTDSSRPYLMTTDDHTAGYINATFCDVYNFICFK
ncbi:receptor-type tyrosine-protein phosphatase epsilon-like [Amphiura filiformis]|uniref:receptor-type tyrosine-protein phosphatase epsilon-like n=1 Tax=Amphiura filiformis TaxID=82378 RepID=UPI003B225015